LWPTGIAHEEAPARDAESASHVPGDELRLVEAASPPTPVGRGGPGDQTEGAGQFVVARDRGREFVGKKSQGPTTSLHLGGENDLAIDPLVAQR